MPTLTTPGVDHSEVDAVYVSLSPEGQEAVVGRFTNQQRIVKVRDGDADRAKAIRDKLAAFPPGEAPQHIVDLEAALPPEEPGKSGATGATGATAAGATGATGPTDTPPAAPPGDQVPSLEETLAAYTVVQLKEELTNRGLDTDGLKADLIQRLIDDGWPN